MILFKKPEMQGARFSRNETYLSYVAVSGKLKQRRRLGFLAESSMYFVRFLYMPIFLKLLENHQNTKIKYNSINGK